MEEGNLHDRMFKKVTICTLILIILYIVSIQKKPLSWRQRSKILKDICRGLAWLHGVTPPVMHGDVKMFV